MLSIVYFVSRLRCVQIIFSTVYNISSKVYGIYLTFDLFLFGKQFFLNIRIEHFYAKLKVIKSLDKKLIIRCTTVAKKVS